MARKSHLYPEKTSMIKNTSLAMVFAMSLTLSLAPAQAAGSLVTRYVPVPNPIGPSAAHHVRSVFIDQTDYPHGYFNSTPPAKAALREISSPV